MCPSANFCGGAFLFMKFFKDNGLNVFSMKTLALFLSKRSYAPHHLASQGASPQGEALTKARIALFAEENFVSKILCRQEGKPMK